MTTKPKDSFDYALDIGDNLAKATAIMMVSDMHPPFQLRIQSESNRTLEQNKLMWALLGHISRQVKHHNAVLKPEEWKDLFTASIRDHRLMPSLEGHSMVLVGMRTHKFSKKEMAELIDRIECFIAENNVRVPAAKRYETESA